jgi:hypothetical protein
MAGQTIALKDHTAKTKVEDFLETRGSIVVKVFHDLGNLSAAYGAEIKFTTLRLFNPGNVENCTEGIRVEIKEDQDSSSTHSAFLVADEVDALQQGVGYMSNLAAQSQGYRGDYTEVIFSTKGDLKVGFYVADGKVQAFMKLGYGSVYLPPSMLHRISELLRSGQKYLRNTPVNYAG